MIAARAYAMASRPRDFLLWRGLSPPEISETHRRKFSVAHRVLNVAMAEVSLQRSCVVPFVGQRVATGMPEHVRMGLEAQLGLRARPLHHAGEASGREWRSPF
jgi:hypothetical protein